MQQIRKCKTRTPQRAFFEELEELTLEEQRRAARRELDALLRSATTVVARIERCAS